MKRNEIARKELIAQSLSHLWSDTLAYLGAVMASWPETFSTWGQYLTWSSTPEIKVPQFGWLPFYQSSNLSFYWLLQEMFLFFPRWHKAKAFSKIARYLSGGQHKNLQFEQKFNKHRRSLFASVEGSKNASLILLILNL